MEKRKIKLILASASPRRKELLGHLKLPFEVSAKNIEEYSPQKDPKGYCQDISEQKGSAVFADWKNSLHDVLVVSADTIVCLDDKIFGKPSHISEARDFLNQLSGHTHSVFTAVTLNLKIQNQMITHSFVEESRVTFNPITPSLMELYLSTGDSLDKAGAYGIQGPSLTFISRIEGDYANVVGFPLSRFVLECEKIFKPFYPGTSWLEHF
jgi:septum formation protein